MHCRNSQRIVVSLALLGFPGCVRKPGPSATSDAGTDAASLTVSAPAVPDASLASPVWLAPMLISTPVMSDMAVPGRDGRGVADDGQIKGFRIGYLRLGEKVRAYPEPHASERCAEGWYE